MKRNILLLCLICWMSVGVSYAYEPFNSSVPSEQTINSDLPSTRSSIDTDGPPEESWGGGGAVGTHPAPIEDGIVPIALVGIAYLLFVLNRKKKIQIQ